MRVIAIWMMFAAGAIGFETAGWRINLERLIEGGLKHPKVVKLEKAPAESAFFEEGDELWDVLPALELELTRYEFRKPGDFDPFAATADGDHVKRVHRPFPGRWMVWNSRSEMLVARGTLMELGMIDETLRLKEEIHLIRTKVVVGHEGGEESLMVACLSGSRGSAKGKKIEMEASANATEGLEWLDMQLGPALKLGDGTVDVVNSGITKRVDERVEVARWKDRSRDWKMDIENEVVTVDGVSIQSYRTMEDEGRIVTVGLDGPYDDTKLVGAKLKGGLKVRLFNVPPDFAAMISEGVEEGGKEGDCWKLSDLVIPGQFSGKLAGRYGDLTESFRKNGVSFATKGSVAGFDPRRCRVLMINDSANQEITESICATLDGDYWVSAVVIEFDWGEGSCSVLTRSGEKASIVRSGGGKTLSSMEVAPNVRSGGKVVDLSFTLQIPDGPTFKSEIVLRNGKPAEVGNYELDGRKLKVVVTAEVLRHDW